MRCATGDRSSLHGRGNYARAVIRAGLPSAVRVGTTATRRVPYQVAPYRGAGRIAVRPGITNRYNAQTSRDAQVALPSFMNGGTAERINDRVYMLRRP